MRKMNPKSIANLHPLKKGDKGLSKGRPKGSKNKATIYNNYLSEKIDINNKKKTRFEHIMDKLFDKAIKGDVRVMLEIMKHEVWNIPEDKRSPLFTIINQIKNTNTEELKEKLIDRTN